MGGLLLGGGGLRGLLRGVDTPVVGGRYIEDIEMVRGFEGRRFALRGLGSGEVGIIVVEGGDTRPTSRESGCRSDTTGETERKILGTRKQSTSTWNRRCFGFPSTEHGLHSIVNGVVLALLVGLMILILYYENTRFDTRFERWMDSDTFGVHFLFAGMGVLITIFWDAQFSRTFHFSFLSFSLDSTRSVPRLTCINQ